MSDTYPPVASEVKPFAQYSNACQNVRPKAFEVGNIKPHAISTCGLYGLPAIFHSQHALSIAIAFIT